MRLVLDTNSVVSGLLWGGTPGQLIAAAQTGRIKIVSSTPLLAELQGVFAAIAPTIARDPADEHVFACARRRRGGHSV